MPAHYAKIHTQEHTGGSEDLPDLPPAALALGVGRDGRSKAGLGHGDLRDVLKGLAVGFPGGVVGSLAAEDAADGLVVEKLGATDQESVAEGGFGDFFGLLRKMSVSGTLDC